MSQQTEIEAQVLRVFGALVFGDLPLTTFQQWVFATPDIAVVVGDDNYFVLLEVEYRLPSAQNEVMKLVANLAEQHWPGRLLREQVYTILCDLVRGSLHVISACEQLAWWHHNGAPWIPRIFVGINSELDAAPDPTLNHLWEPDALATKLAEVEPWVAQYRGQAHAEAQRLLRDAFPERTCP